MIQTINPTTEEIIQTYPALSQHEAFKQVKIAHRAYQSWKLTSIDKRQSCMMKLSELLLEHRVEFAKLMAKEMGKPISAGQVEIEKCAWVCAYYAEQAPAYLAAQLVNTDHKEAHVVHCPLGVVLGIMPWNFPFWQVFRYAVPTVMAGNTTLLKHAPITTGSGEAIQSLFDEAGFPVGVFRQLVIENDVAADVIGHPNVIGVTFTGSAFAGRIIAEQAGRHLKKIVLELGGSDPAIVLDDADIALAAEVILSSRLNNTGQVCISAKRIIATKSILPELIKAIQLGIQSYEMGDPLDSSTMLGPMARQDLRMGVHNQVERSVSAGAQLLQGGQLPTGKGYYYPPTILTQVKPGMPAFDEEVFGPVLSFIEADDELDAIALANQTEFGLGASIFTRDLEKGKKIATDDIEAGSCFVNGKVSSDPRLPFGGIKHSGFGRELSKEGMLAFMNKKTVAVAHV